MKTLTTQQFEELRQDKNPTVVNTLEKEHFEKKHIPKSINVPVSAPDLEQRVEGEAGGKDKPVVVYCAGQECDASAKAGKRLEEAGFSQVYDFEGGTEAWEKAGHPIEGKGKAAAGCC